MSLVLEDGTGVVTANAYASVAEVGAILDATSTRSGASSIRPVKSGW
jgi:hypothetical protein